MPKGNKKKPDVPGPLVIIDHTAEYTANRTTSTKPKWSNNPNAPIYSSARECGVINRQGRPCQRIGVCPFHPSKSSNSPPTDVNSPSPERFQTVMDSKHSFESSSFLLHQRTFIPSSSTPTVLNEHPPSFSSKRKEGSDSESTNQKEKKRRFHWPYREEDVNVHRVPSPPSSPNDRSAEYPSPPYPYYPPPNYYAGPHPHMHRGTLPSFSYYPHPSEHPHPYPSVHSPSSTYPPSIYYPSFYHPPSYYPPSPRDRERQQWSGPPLQDNEENHHAALTMANLASDSHRSERRSSSPPVHHDVQPVKETKIETREEILREDEPSSRMHQRILPPLPSNYPPPSSFYSGPLPPLQFPSSFQNFPPLHRPPISDEEEDDGD